METPLRLVDSLVADDARPGDGKYGTGSCGSESLNFRCPTCNKIIGVRFGDGDNPRWDLKGPRSKPTLSPSIRHIDLDCGWHGWLREGIFSDCT